MATTIVSNRQARDVLYWHDLTAKEQAQFDYLDTEQAQEDATFFRYKGATYNLGEFMRTNSPELKAWDGIATDSYFSGTLVKMVDHGEGVIVGRCYS